MQFLLLIVVAFIAIATAFQSAGKLIYIIIYNIVDVDIYSIYIPYIFISIIYIYNYKYDI